MDTRTSLFHSSNEDAVHAFTAATGGIDLGIYPLGEANHVWHGRVHGDIALLTWRDDLVWHASLEVETIADDGNEISFRLVRLFYQFRTAVDLKLGPGVLSLALNHRCGHGTDGALPGRILIRTGVDTSYRASHRWGDLELSWLVHAHATVLGQNRDLNSQVRGLLSGAAQLSYDLPHDFQLVASAGMGVALQGGSASDIYLISDAADGLKAAPLPVAAIGGRYSGLGASFGLFLHYQRIVDTGLTEATQPASLFSLRLRFGW
ncbi:MAG: hypothetical protein ACPGU1_21255 [Myxococcota bacterium]